MQTKTIEPRRLRRLALAIAAAPACEFDELVTFFVDEELRSDAKRVHALRWSDVGALPALRAAHCGRSIAVTWKHIPYCKRCSQSYHLLKSALTHAEDTHDNVSR